MNNEEQEEFIKRLEGMSESDIRLALDQKRWNKHKIPLAQEHLRSLESSRTEEILSRQEEREDKSLDNSSKALLEARKANDISRNLLSEASRANDTARLMKKITIWATIITTILTIINIFISIKSIK